jgi:hypothetical protein
MLTLIYRRFRQGHGTSDLADAKLLIAELKK